jgi:hypothetical protein
MPYPRIDIGSSRRVIHLALLVGGIVAVRAYGGGTGAEGVMADASRWIAEKTGMVVAKKTWDGSIRPAVSTATKVVTDGVDRAVSQVLAGAESAAEGTTTSVDEQLDSLASRIANGMRSILGTSNANPPDEGQAKGAQAPNDRRPSDR